MLQATEHCSDRGAAMEALTLIAEARGRTLLELASTWFCRPEPAPGGLPSPVRMIAVLNHPLR